MKTLSAKDPSESVTVTFDYERGYPGATLTVPSVSAVVQRGTDNNPSALLSGAPQIQGLKVLQQIIGGLPFVDYELRCSAIPSTAPGAIMRTAVLPVRTL